MRESRELSVLHKHKVRMKIKKRRYDAKFERNINLQLLIIVALIFGLPLPAFALFTGTAHFIPSGRLASAVSYIDVSISIDLAAVKTRIFTTLNTVHNSHVELERELDFAGDTAAVTQLISQRKAILAPVEADLSKIETKIQAIVPPDARDKREGFGFAALLGAIFNWGSNQNTHREVEDLRKIATKQAVLFGELSHVEEELSRKVKNITSLLSKEETVLFDTLILYAQLQSYANACRDLVEGLIAIQRHHVHPGLVTPAVITDVMARATRESRRISLVPVFSEDTQVYDVPTSFLFEAGMCHVIFHFPYVNSPDSDIRELWLLEGGVINRTGKVHEVVAKDYFIAATPLAARNGLHSTHDSKELAPCQVVNQVRLCSHIATTVSTPHSCVAALFYQDERKTYKYCEMNPLERTFPVVQINSTAFMIGINETVQLACTGSHPVTLVRQEVFIYDLRRGCKLVHKDFTAEPAAISHLTTTTITLDWEIEKHIASRAPVQTPKAILTLESSLDGLTEKASRDAEKSKTLVKELEKEPSKTLMYALIGAGCIIVVLLLVLALIFLYFYTKSGAAGPWEFLFSKALSSANTQREQSVAVDDTQRNDVEQAVFRDPQPNLTQRSPSARSVICNYETTFASPRQKAPPASKVTKSRTPLPTPRRIVGREIDALSKAVREFGTPKAFGGGWESAPLHFNMELGALPGRHDQRGRGLELPRVPLPLRQHEKALPNQARPGSSSEEEGTLIAPSPPPSPTVQLQKSKEEDSPYQAIFNDGNLIHVAGRSISKEGQTAWEGGARAYDQYLLKREKNTNARLRQQLLRSYSHKHPSRGSSPRATVNSKQPFTRLEALLLHPPPPQDKEEEEGKRENSAKGEQPIQETKLSTKSSDFSN